MLAAKRPPLQRGQAQELLSLRRPWTIWVSAAAILPLAGLEKEP